MYNIKQSRPFISVETKLLVKKIKEMGIGFNSSEMEEVIISAISGSSTAHEQISKIRRKIRVKKKVLINCYMELAQRN